ncbi:ASPRV1 [Cordylochernes scorpioides]|uniref:ASPRV1 n=1 Tax=Cordylochernes scorpioides TaxID=51811 RepID=A0ABY6KMB0_9ARAC|nr:ASPRV1 [Cordylochernes scorpioides]
MIERVKDYNRAARYDGWDDFMSLDNVIFFLEDTAKRWYDIEVENLTSWQTFREALLEMFGDRKSLAKESSESYIQDILALCRQVYPAMMEGEKLGHLMKGVKEHIYQALFPFCSECKRIETLDKNRIGKPQFERRVNVTSISTDNNADIEELLRWILKEISNMISGLNSPIIPKQLEEEVYQRAEKPLTPIIKHPKSYNADQKAWYDAEKN